MNRDGAIRLDGMLIGVRGNLDSIAYFMKNNMREAEYLKLIKYVADSMGVLVELSMALHSEFPDTLPEELKPTPLRE